MFELTEEQIEEIIDLYGGSVSTINKIEQKLNEFNVIRDEEEYLEIVTSILSQHQSIRLQISLADKREMPNKYMTLDQIVDMELTRRCEENGYQLKKTL